MGKHPCGICQKAFANTHKAFCSDICNKFQQIKLTNSFQNKFLLEITKTFETELKRENWKHTLGLHLKDVNHSFEKVLETINNALDKHAPNRPMSRKEQKTAKHWITKGI